MGEEVGEGGRERGREEEISKTLNTHPSKNALTSYLNVAAFKGTHQLPAGHTPHLHEPPHVRRG